MVEARILIVERNEKIRLLLSGDLRDRGCEVSGVADGVAAARHLRAQLPDLLLIDQDVPLGGVKIARLLRLHPNYQQLPIVLLVDRQQAARELVEEGRKLNLEAFIVKPFTGAALETKIEQCLRQRLAKISPADIRRQLAELTELPVLLSNHRKMVELLSREDTQVDVPELIRTIELDQGLTTKILRVCHAAYYGFRGNSIEGAITFLGIDKVRRIVQAAVIFDIFGTAEEGTDADGFSVLELWKHSVASGLIMEAGGHRVKGRDHFIAGMLHDIGKVILRLRFPEHFAEIRRLVQAEGKSMCQAEQELLGVTHADLGHELAKKWQLPPTIATAIGFHHQPSAALQHKRLTSLVHLSDILARTLEIGHGGDRVKAGINPTAAPLAKYVFAISRERERLVAEVESVVFEGRI